MVYRADPLDLKEMDVDVTKKSGKDLGLGFAECKGNGIYITEIVIEIANWLSTQTNSIFFSVSLHTLDTRWNHWFGSSYDQGWYRYSC